MGMYQDRMISDMRVRGYSEKTQTAYTWHMRLFIKFCKAPPDRISLRRSSVSAPSGRSRVVVVVFPRRALSNGKLFGRSQGVARLLWEGMSGSAKNVERRY